MDKLIVLEPEKELEFTRPFTQSVVTQYLTVTNTSSDTNLAFKVKTTAPKQYCVRPNSGLLKPKEMVEIQILLQQMKEDPPSEFVCKDKFLVQFIKVSADVVKEAVTNSAVLAEAWTSSEALKRSVPDSQTVVLEKKLRCVFMPDKLAPTSASSSPKRDKAPSIGSERKDGGLSSYSSPTTAAGGDRDLKEAKDKIKTLQTAVEVYKAEIERINALRIRKATTEKGGDGSMQTARKAQTISKLLLVFVALISFFIGYYFF